MASWAHHEAVTNIPGSKKGEELIVISPDGGIEQMVFPGGCLRINTSLTVFRIGRSESDVSVVVIVGHSYRFARPIIPCLRIFFLARLDDAYRIDPYVSYVEPSGELHHLLECFWYVLPWNTLTLPVVVLARCHALRLELTPAVAQSGVWGFVRKATGLAQYDTFHFRAVPDVYKSSRE